MKGIKAMKICTNCGSQCMDDSSFCTSCGSQTFAQYSESVQPAPLPQPRVKPDFTVFDLMTIFGFVASLVGLFQIGLILEPLALLSTIAGFAKGKRCRGLAIAGFVIAAIGLLVRLFETLYRNNIIPQWLIIGALG